MSQSPFEMAGQGPLPQQQHSVRPERAGVRPPQAREPPPQHPEAVFKVPQQPKRQKSLAEVLPDRRKVHDQSVPQGMHHDKSSDQNELQKKSLLELLSQRCKLQEQLFHQKVQREMSSLRVVQGLPSHQKVPHVKASHQKVHQHHEKSSHQKVHHDKSSHQKVPVVKSSHQKVPVVKSSHQKVPVVKSSHQKVPGVKSSHLKVPVVKSSHLKVPGVKLSHQQVPGIKTSHQKVPGVKSSHQKMLGEKSHLKVPGEKSSHQKLHHKKSSHQVHHEKSSHQKVSGEKSSNQKLHHEKSSHKMLPHGKSSHQKVLREKSSNHRLLHEKSSNQKLDSQQKVPYQGVPHSKPPHQMASASSLPRSKKTTQTEGRRDLLEKLFKYCKESHPPLPSGKNPLKGWTVRAALDLDILDLESPNCGPDWIKPPKELRHPLLWVSPSDPNFKNFRKLVVFLSLRFRLPLRRGVGEYLNSSSEPKLASPKVQSAKSVPETPHLKKSGSSKPSAKYYKPTTQEDSLKRLPSTVVGTATHVPPDQESRSKSLSETRLLDSISIQLKDSDKPGQSLSSETDSLAAPHPETRCESPWETNTATFLNPEPRCESPWETDIDSPVFSGQPRCASLLSNNPVNSPQSKSDIDSQKVVQRVSVEPGSLASLKRKQSDKSASLDILFSEDVIKFKHFKYDVQGWDEDYFKICQTVDETESLMVETTIDVPEILECSPQIRNPNDNHELSAKDQCPLIDITGDSPEAIWCSPLACDQNNGPPSVQDDIQAHPASPQEPGSYCNDSKSSENGVVEDIDMITDEQEEEDYLVEKIHCVNNSEPETLRCRGNEGVQSAGTHLNIIEVQYQSQTTKIDSSNRIYHFRSILIKIAQNNAKLLNEKNFSMMQNC
ncbi:uncharacterized protein LOC113207124 isoform X6 [Frankliniella occidentalis]|uniref:Uncharacterized protein LOC113207124 isoform X6 n=1 Tax=Frankliniella occidentalis TaxID=133901 RepID=A0A9C6X8G6_FRAOC|nr:uncharacterized protein LOC113207124 isoform X6 [Frankliniella occidentalis]